MTDVINTSDSIVYLFMNRRLDCVLFKMTITISQLIDWERPHPYISDGNVSKGIEAAADVIQESDESEHDSKAQKDREPTGMFHLFNSCDYRKLIIPY